MRNIKIKILNFLLKNLYNSIDTEDILTVTKQGYKIGNTILDRNQIEGLKNQASVIKQSDLWKYVSNNLKYLANYQMYRNSKNIDDLIFGKAMLYNLDIINKLFNKISER